MPHTRSVYACIKLLEKHLEEVKELDREPLDSPECSSCRDDYDRSDLQYSWTLFVKPIIGATHWKLSGCAVGIHNLHRPRNLGDALFRVDH